MIENIILYICGALIVSNLITIWNITNLPVHIYDLLSCFKKSKKKLYTRPDWETHVSIEWGIWGELLICPLCFATHLSWITALCIFWVSQCSPWFILYTTLSWPMIAYIFLKKNKQ
ncbi:hypothetical protein CL634_10115 [bacterium]|nr:hypothetical protein [bacterium]